MTFNRLRTIGLAVLLAGASAAQTPPAVVNSSFPPGIVGTQYAQSLAAVGGVAPYSWSLAGGSLPPGLTLSSIGVIAGVPATAGTYQFTLTVTDARQQTGSRTLSITISGGHFSIATSTPLPAGTAGQAYSLSLTVTGGVAPFQWTVGPGLPPGIGVNTSTGVISGTPTTGGTYTFTVQATDAAQNTASATFSLTIGTTSLTITTSPTLFSGVVGQTYSQTFAAAGGKPPYAWTIASGSTGVLTLDAASGILSGTPQSAGTLNFTIRVTDSAGAVAQQSFSISVTAPALTITATTTALPPGTAGVSYSQKLPVGVVGGTPPYTWSLTSGSVPGLVFDPTAIALNGTPTSAGTFNVTVQVTDSAGLTASKTLTLTIPSAALNIVTARQLPDAALNTFYSQMLTATGGAPPYVWSVTGLPAGLSINASTGAINGTPTAAGTFPLAITVTDSTLSHYVDRFTLNVNLPSGPPVTLSGLPGTASPAQQYPLQVTLGNPYPADISGQLILTFSPDTGPTDQTVQFASGGTTANFSVPAGSVTAISSAPLALQTGTASGILTISLRLQAGGIDITPSPVPSVTTQVNQAAPVIESLQVTRTSNTLSVVVTGYSTARQVTQAVFTFAAASGQTLQTTASSVTIDVSTLFGNWFQNAANSQFGTQFIFTQPFTIQGDPNGVVPVSVTLTNRIGTTTTKFGN